MKSRKSSSQITNVFIETEFASLFHAVPRGSLNRTYQCFLHISPTLHSQRHCKNSRAYCSGFLTGLSATIFSCPQFIPHADDVTHFLKLKRSVFQRGDLNSLASIQESRWFVTTLLLLDYFPLFHLVHQKPQKKGSLSRLNVPLISLTTSMYLSCSLCCSAFLFIPTLSPLESFENFKTQLERGMPRWLSC